MFKINCKCGESEKNFKFNIGEFFIADCCEKAGYDERGFKEGEEEALISMIEDSKQEMQDIAKQEEATLIEDTIVATIQDLSKLNQEALQKLCKGRDIEFKGNDSKAVLREKLK